MTNQCRASQERLPYSTPQKNERFEFRATLGHYAPKAWAPSLVSRATHLRRQLIS